MAAGPFYNRKKAAGICVVCDAPSAPFVHCPKCRRVNRERVKAYARSERHENSRAARRKRKACPNCGGEKVPGKSLCQPCNDKVRARYYSRKEAGVCVKCGQRPFAREGRVLCGECEAVSSAYLSAYHHERRLRAMNAYGGPVCACCGEDKIEFLTIDHINGGGNQHRRAIKTNIVVWLIKNNFPPGFRVLCMNCNWACGKYGFCPHQRPTGSPPEAVDPPSGSPVA